MKNRNRPNGETAIFLGRSSEFEGDLKFYGTARVEGHLRGNISGEGILVIGKEGKIEADAHVSRAIIYGKIHGDIVAEEKIEIKVSGKVFGTIEAPVILIEAGAIFQGKCQTQQPKVVEKDELGKLCDEWGPNLRLTLGDSNCSPSTRSYSVRCF